MRNAEYYRVFFNEKRGEIGSNGITIWGNTELGQEIAEYCLSRGGIVDAIIDRDATEESVEIICRKGLADIKSSRICLFTPLRYDFNREKFIVIAAKRSSAEIEEYVKKMGVRYEVFYRWMTEKSSHDIKFLQLRARELRNLVGVLYSFQEYQSDLIVDDKYRNALIVTTAIGCPVYCRYCPQDEFVKAYNKRPNPVKRMTLSAYKTFLDKVPIDVIVSFTGMVEPFANPECLDMVLHTLDKGHKVRVFSTMYNQSIEAYNAFKDHENLKTFDVHLPDSQGNTVFPLTERYLELLEYIVKNKPKYGRFWTSCLGIDGGPSEEIRGIINVSGNPINSIHGLAYDNYLDHGSARLSCKYDCSRMDHPAAGIGMLFPNGDVTGCTQDWELLHIIGNMYNVGSWEELMQSDERKKFISGLENASLRTICRKCELALKVNASDIN